MKKRSRMYETNKRGEQHFRQIRFTGTPSSGGGRCLELRQGDTTVSIVEVSRSRAHIFRSFTEPFTEL
jgi:hypothetical protein